MICIFKIKHHITCGRISLCLLQWPAESVISRALHLPVRLVGVKDRTQNQAGHKGPFSEQWKRMGEGGDEGEGRALLWFCTTVMCSVK